LPTKKSTAAQGFRMKLGAVEVKIWADPKTLLPIRVEETSAGAAGSDTRIVMSDFQVGMELDESLFSVEVPAGYTVQQTMQIDASKKPAAYLAEAHPTREPCHSLRVPAYGQAAHDAADNGIPHDPRPIFRKVECPRLVDAEHDEKEGHSVKGALAEPRTNSGNDPAQNATNDDNRAENDRTDPVRACTERTDQGDDENQQK
jgi:hypothetical protein